MKLMIAVASLSLINGVPGSNPTHGVNTYSLFGVLSNAGRDLSVISLPFSSNLYRMETSDPYSKMTKVMN
jgi:hypothetical protein